MFQIRVYTQVSRVKPEPLKTRKKVVPQDKKTSNLFRLAWPHVSKPGVFELVRAQTIHTAQNKHTKSAHRTKPCRATNKAHTHRFCEKLRNSMSFPNRAVVFKQHFPLRLSQSDVNQTYFLGKSCALCFQRTSFSVFSAQVVQSEHFRENETRCSLPVLCFSVPRVFLPHGSSPEGKKQKRVKAWRFQTRVHVERCPPAPASQQEHVAVYTHVVFNQVELSCAPVHQAVCHAGCVCAMAGCAHPQQTPALATQRLFIC